jgi:hypothetical protein
MLISKPTGTSTIFGVFQAIMKSPVGNKLLAGDQIVAIKISTDERRLRATTTSPNDRYANTMTLPSA